MMTDHNPYMTQVDNPLNFTSLEEVDPTAIGYAQWICIDDLEKKYKGKKINGSNNYFEDDKWVSFSNEKSTIHWSKINENGNNHALLLLLKIGVYYQINSKSTTINTLKGYLSGLMNILKTVINHKNLLVGSKNEVLLGFNEISSNDLEKAIDTKISSGYCIDGNTVGSLNIIKEIPPHAVNNLAIFMTHFDYPWTNGFSSWLNKRHVDLGVSIYESKPFKALPSATFQQIIERSMHMIEIHGEYIVTILHEEKKSTISNSRSFLSSKDGAAFMNSYPKIFNKLTNLDAKHFDGKLSYRRSTIRIVNLLKAACINIILLTTGLRNIDLRYLKVESCKPSGSVDILNYLDVNIAKTKNRVLLPVPDQTRIAIDLLERLRWDESNPYVISSSDSGNMHAVNSITGKTLNRWLAVFANHFNIPFSIVSGNDTEYTAHCYRATVAGWLDSSSNLAILLIKRLFGHTNSLMPLAYLHHNPNFIKARKESLEEASDVMSARMAKGAQHNLLSGRRGDDLVRGFEKHKTELTVSSESLSDKELFTTFKTRIKERIVSGSMFAMMTPFGVVCTRNPNDSTPTPCAKLSDRKMLKELGVNKELWDYMQSSPNPSQCIGKLCEHAMLGPWSTAIKDSFLWYVGLLEGRVGQELTTDELRIEARSFIEQYAPDMQKIFVVVSSDA